MAHIVANNLSLHYPLNAKPNAGTNEQSAPKNHVQIGRKHYIHALKNLNFEFKRGDRVGLVGRNGSGKSTLLRVLGGIYTPTGGILKSRGQISSLFNLNLGVQNDLSGRQNIVIRGIVKGWSRKKIQAQIPQIIEFSDLRDVIDLPIRSYSDGMRMRLLFAIATSFSPEILLLDEWIGAGDDKFRSKAAARMNSLVADAGITVVASHNRNLIKKVCDKVMWLHNGSIVACGPAQSTFEQMDAFFAEQDGSLAGRSAAKPKLIETSGR